MVIFNKICLILPLYIFPGCGKIKKHRCRLFSSENLKNKTKPAVVLSSSEVIHSSYQSVILKRQGSLSFSGHH